MLAIILFTALLVIRGAPDSVPGRALGRWLVDWPAARLARLTRGQLAGWLMLGLAVSAVIAILGQEAMLILGMALPDTIAWLAMFDMSVLADALLAATLVAAHVRLGRVRSLLSRLRPGRARPRTPAPRRHRKAAPKADNDGDPAPAFAVAA